MSYVNRFSVHRLPINLSAASRHFSSAGETVKKLGVLAIPLSATGWLGNNPVSEAAAVLGGILGGAALVVTLRIFRSPCQDPLPSTLLDQFTIEKDVSQIPYDRLPYTYQKLDRLQHQLLPHKLLGRLENYLKSAPSNLNKEEKVKWAKQKLGQSVKGMMERLVDLAGQYPPACPLLTSYLIPSGKKSDDNTYMRIIEEVTEQVIGNQKNRLLELWSCFSPEQREKTLNDIVTHLEHNWNEEDRRYEWSPHWMCHFLKRVGDQRALPLLNIIMNDSFDSHSGHPTDLSYCAKEAYIEIRSRQEEQTRLGTPTTPIQS